MILTSCVQSKTLCLAVVCLMLTLSDTANAFGPLPVAWKRDQYSGANSACDTTLVGSTSESSCLFVGNAIEVTNDVGSAVSTVGIGIRTSMYLDCSASPVTLRLQTYTGGSGTCDVTYSSSITGSTSYCVRFTEGTVGGSYKLSCYDPSTSAPTKSPTSRPSASPSKSPSRTPSKSPSKTPSNGPTTSPTSLMCRPNYGDSKARCSARIKYCQQFGVKMKWRGKGCRGSKGQKSGDGGCQCLEYCGYQCKPVCNHDKRCTWQDGACRSKGTLAVGGPISQCT